MEEQDLSGKSDYLINSPATDNPVADPVPDPAPSLFQSSEEPEKKASILTEPPDRAGGLTPPKKRLSEAFWEGVTSAKSGHKKESPPPRESPPAPENRPTSDQSGSLDWVVQGGKSAVSAIGQAASSVVDSVANLAKKSPAIPTQWGEAFREGAASVRKPGAVKPKSEPAPPRAGNQTAFGQGIWNSMSQIGDTAAGIVRDALSTFKPGEAGEIEKKIHQSEKKIRDLYLEIGQEAAESWSSGGPGETEKTRALLDELINEEEVIQKLKAYSSQFTVVKKAPAAEAPSMAPEIRSESQSGIEIIAAPDVQKEVAQEETFSILTADETLEPGDQSTSPEAGMILSAIAEAEPLTAPLEAEPSLADEPAAQEEDGAGDDQNLSFMAEGGREKIEGVLEK